MNYRFCLFVTLASLDLLGTAFGLARADEANKKLVERNPTPEQVRKTTERALEFIAVDAQKWRKDRECSTCHHGTLTVWTLSDAKQHGFTIDESLSDMSKWAKERLSEIHKPRELKPESPGSNMVSTPALYMAVMAQAVPKQDVVTAEDLQRIVDHLVRHQEDDGSWAWSLAPAKNRAPPHFESDEVATLLAYLALRPYVPTDPNEKSAVREARAKAVAWLAKTPPTDTTQAAALRLLRKVWEGETLDTLPSDVDNFIRRQNEDGGWGQNRDLPSDAYATGQALYYLSLARVTNQRAAVQRGVAYLVASQNEDGSWPMTPRAHPGAKPANNRVPIIYFGSAWATLGLIQSAEK